MQSSLRGSNFREIQLVPLVNLGASSDGAGQSYDGPSPKLLLTTASAGDQLHPGRERELQHHGDEEQLRQIRVVAAKVKIAYLIFLKSVLSFYNLEIRKEDLICFIT